MLLSEKAGLKRLDSETSRVTEVLQAKEVQPLGIISGILMELLAIEKQVFSQAGGMMALMPA